MLSAAQSAAACFSDTLRVSAIMNYFSKILITTVTAGWSRRDMSSLEFLSCLVLFLSSFSKNMLSPFFFLFCLSLSLYSKSSEIENTVQSLYKTTCYNTDLDIMQSLSRAQVQ